MPRKKRQVAELAKLDERTSGPGADNSCAPILRFLSDWQASKGNRCGLRTKPNDRQMSLEDTLPHPKNKPSGMKNALVCSEILTARRMALGSEEKHLRSTPIYFFWGPPRKTSHLLS
jgi:hypothetical protein